MIAFVAGTTAELIKVAPVREALVERGADVALWSTGQHTNEVEPTLRDLGAPDPERWLVPRRHLAHISRVAQVPAWALRVLRTAVAERRALAADLARDGRPGLVVVHGDTFTTVLGAVLGRVVGARVAHVEAGLRSGSMLSPFPEELNRRVVGRLADLHFAPTAREVANLRRARGVVVETGANTVVDALRRALERAPEVEGLPEHYGLVTLHRFELLRQPERLEEVLRTLHAARDATPLVMVAGESERARITELGLDHLFDDRFQLWDKRAYAAFLPMLARADFVVTDSGGLQEECAVLGVPCAVHRERTERHQGLGANVVLTRMDAARLTAFLDGWRELRRPSELDRFRPSEQIAATLDELGFVATRAGSL
ncbi:UDP-N-acetylglucosamine 2-epimerase [Actinotalea sp. AC32]|nr:UDP-N-acetylglucosamine 2-epimerase [Actinotalea sp. AC32]